MENKTDITELVAEALWDVFRLRIDAVYEAYKDLPKIQKLERKHGELLNKLSELNSELCEELETTWNSLTALYEELIYRQGVIDSDEYYKAFKELGFISGIEEEGGQNHDSKVS